MVALVAVLGCGAETSAELSVGQYTIMYTWSVPFAPTSDALPTKLTLMVLVSSNDGAAKDALGILPLETTTPE